MSTRSFIVVLFSLGVLGIYLFVTAPPPLEGGQSTERSIPIATALRIINAENDAARALYAKEIVGAGKRVGFEFDERWREPEIVAGPLPALFLRETAQHLEKLPIPLGLFLGSDEPINSANRFSGRQIRAFEEIRRTRQPTSFYEPTLKRYIAMFPDVATVAPCVDCHNQHPDSPTDAWKQGDVMGAVTWSHPASSLSLQEVLDAIGALRESIDFAYGRVIEELGQLDEPPTIGDCWPRDGRCLPSRAVFSKALERRASAGTVRRLLEAQGGAANAFRRNDLN